MEKLNPAATAIFATFIDQLGSADQIALQCSSPSEPELWIGKFPFGFTTPEGISQVYILSQYTFLNDEEKFMPQFSFVVKDRRSHQQDYENLIIRPYMCIDDRSDYFEESIEFYPDRCIPVPDIYEKNLERAHTWLLHLQFAGFLQ